LYLNAPGSVWEQYESVPAFLAILFVADFAANLVPVGYSDGSMLWHLLLWTKHGQDLYTLHLAAKAHNDASRRHLEQDLAGEVQLRRKALSQTLATGDAPSVRLGHCYQALGYALLNHSLRGEAEENLRNSIDVFSRSGDASPIHLANSWK